MPDAGIMVNFTAVESPLNANRFSNANHSEVFSWMVTDSRGKTPTFQTFDFKDHPNAQVCGCHRSNHNSGALYMLRLARYGAMLQEYCI